MERVNKLKNKNWHEICSLSLSLSLSLCTPGRLLTHRMQRKTARYHSATAHFSARDGVLLIDFLGLISQPAISFLDAQLEEHRSNARLVIERMDHAVTCFDAAPRECGKSWRQSFPLSAIIVRQDQYQASLRFSRSLAKQGVVRTVFLPHQSRDIQHWAALALGAAPKAAAVR